MFADANSPYLLAAYLIFVGGMLAYALSLALRARAARQNEARLTELEQETSASSADTQVLEGQSSGS